MGKCSKKTKLLMDRAYGGNETRKLAEELNYEPIVPPKKNRKVPWDYDKELYKKKKHRRKTFSKTQGVSSHLHSL
jgi:hypothetical protein